MTTKTKGGAIDTIRSFLELPMESLPAAGWDDAELGNLIGSPWHHLREAAAGRDTMADGETVYLKADRDGWRAGVRVTLGL